MKGATVIVNCMNCDVPFAARVADRRRGWGKFCSKSCKAINQAYGGQHDRKRHDGISSMAHKFCHCGDRAVNGVYSSTGIEWLCGRHMAEGLSHPFSSEALGQW